MWPEPQWRRYGCNHNSNLNKDTISRSWSYLEVGLQLSPEKNLVKHMGEEKIKVYLRGNRKRTVSRMRGLGAGQDRCLPVTLHCWWQCIGMSPTLSSHFTSSFNLISLNLNSQMTSPCTTLSHPPRSLTGHVQFYKQEEKGQKWSVTCSGLHVSKGQAGLHPKSVECRGCTIGLAKTFGCFLCNASSCT